MAGFPQGIGENIGVVFDLVPPVGIAAVVQIHIQITGHDLIVDGSRGIGKPSEGGADEHGNTQQQSNCAGQKRRFGRNPFCHFQ